MAGLYQGRHRRPSCGDLDGAGRRRPRPSAARQRRAIPASASFRVASGILPDGRWLAYSSSETGRNEVYVRPFSRAESARVAAGRRSPRPAAGSPSGRGAPTGRARAVLPWSRWARHSDRLPSRPRFLHGLQAPSLVRQVRGVDPRSLPLRHGRGQSPSFCIRAKQRSHNRGRPTALRSCLNFFDKLRGPKAGQ